MRTLSRVVWNEGMHLAQHHFQLQSRYFEDSIGFALSHLFFKPYGLAGFELDVEALRNGTVSIIHARGVMPDGLAFHFPDGDPPPPPRQIQDLFSPTQDSHVVSLSVPPYREGRANCALNPTTDDQETRYVAERTQVLDETTGQDERPVTVGRKSFRLRLDSELGEGTVSLPLARVRRDGTGHFIYDPEYIPPSLQIGASPRLMAVLKRLIEILESKSDSLAEQRRATGQSLAEYASHEVANFWLSHAIHASLGPLRHHLNVKSTHPEQLHADLAQLAGALCTFSLNSHPRDLPLYDHDRLNESFRALDEHIRRHLEITIPTSCVAVPLKRYQEYYYAGKVTDTRCLGPSTWILGVQSTMGEAEVISQVPRLVKICSAKHITELVKRAMPGLRLEHLPSPPSAVSPRLGRHYFRISKSGPQGSGHHPCWSGIVQSSGIGVYLPSALPNTELELLVILESPPST